jgi:hypothetical protein
MVIHLSREGKATQPNIEASQCPLRRSRRSLRIGEPPPLLKAALYHAYLRGQAHLIAHSGPAAAAKLQIYWIIGLWAELRD